MLGELDDWLLLMTLLGDGFDDDAVVSEPRNMGVMPNAARTLWAICECVECEVEWTGDDEREPTGLPCAEPADSEYETEGTDENEAELLGSGSIRSEAGGGGGIADELRISSTDL